MGLHFEFRFVKAIPAGTALTLEWTITGMAAGRIARTGSWSSVEGRAVDDAERSSPPATVAIWLPFDIARTGNPTSSGEAYSWSRASILTPDSLLRLPTRTP